MPSKTYSSTFVTKIYDIQTDSDSLTILIKCNSLLHKKSKPIIALSIEKDGFSKFWSSRNLNPISKNTWSENQYRWHINISDAKDHELKIYVWNPKGAECYIDDFCVEIF